MFDIETAFKESGLPLSEIDRIKKEIRKEFPNDDMMYELHIIRLLKRMKKKAS